MTTAMSNKYKLRPHELYIALEELDFSWYPSEVQSITRLWNERIGLADIAETMERDPDECFILLMDLARKGKIQPRENGFWG